jgi:hypothetical protein
MFFDEFKFLKDASLKNDFDICGSEVIGLIYF